MTTWSDLVFETRHPLGGEVLLTLGRLVQMLNGFGGGRGVDSMAINGGAALGAVDVGARYIYHGWEGAANDV